MNGAKRLISTRQNRCASVVLLFSPISVISPPRQWHQLLDDQVALRQNYHPLPRQEISTSWRIGQDVTSKHTNKLHQEKFQSCPRNNENHLHLPLMSRRSSTTQLRMKPLVLRHETHHLFISTLRWSRRWRFPKTIARCLFQWRNKTKCSQDHKDQKQARVAK